MWCALLKLHPEIVSNNLRFFLQPPILDSLHYNAVACQERIAFRVVPLMFWMAVLETVGLYNEPRFGTVEVERVFTKGMLATKFVTGESLIAEHSPEELFSP